VVLCKWFFAIIRQHKKCTPFFGVYLVNHAIRHKSHVNSKMMVIASTAFETKNNDMERGGIAHKVSFTWPVDQSRKEFLQVGLQG
jgi:hypothetical protein